MVLDLAHLKSSLNKFFGNWIWCIFSRVLATTAAGGCYSVLIIDGHVCWISNRRLPFIVCSQRKRNSYFPFPFTANKRRFAVSVFRLQQTWWNIAYCMIFWSPALPINKLKWTVNICLCTRYTTSCSDAWALIILDKKSKEKACLVKLPLQGHRLNL